MGIRVECPHGHVFKVKDKYAGKKGLCPKCDGQVVVHVPGLEEAAELAAQQVLREEVQARHPQVASPHGGGGSESVLDDSHAPHDASTSASLLGSSVITHKTKCECGAKVPMWFAKCPGCGRFLEH